MHGRKEWNMRRKRHVIAVLMVAAAGAFALLTAGTGAASRAVTGPSGWVGNGGGVTSDGSGFGETFSAPNASLTHALFSAKLLPASKSAKNITLASYGRVTKKVNYALALKCWKNNG